MPGKEKREGWKTVKCKRCCPKSGAKEETIEASRKNSEGKHRKSRNKLCQKMLLLLYL